MRWKVGLGLFLCVASLATSVPAGEPEDWLAGPEAATAASRIIGTALVQSHAYETLAYLTDRIGNRLSGSEALEKGIVWATSELERDGLDRVWTEEVNVPHWVRGEESGRIVSPVMRKIALIGLGGTTATPRHGLRAQVLEVHDLEELEAAGTTRGATQMNCPTMPAPSNPTQVAAGPWVFLSPPVLVEKTRCAALPGFFPSSTPTRSRLRVAVPMWVA